MFTMGELKIISFTGGSLYFNRKIFEQETFEV